MNLRKQPFIFIIATDDLAWCKEHLATLPEVLNRESGKDLMISSHYSDHYRKEHVNRVHFDMAVMSKCNHSIYDYGTFGFWGAYLANGITVSANVGHGYLIGERIKNSKLRDWHFIQFDLEGKNQTKRRAQTEHR